MSIKNNHAAIVFLGVSTSQLILFFCFGLIGRVWGVEALGDFSFNLALASFLSVIAALRYELTCIQDTESSAYSALLHTILVILIVLPVSNLLIFGFKYQSLLTVTLAVALAGQQASSLYFNTSRKYISISLTKVASAGGFALVLYFGAMVHTRVEPFVLYASSSAFLTLTIVFFILRKGGFKKISFRFYKENSSFPKFSLLAATLSSALTNALPIAIPFMFGSSAAGFFAVAQRFGFAPVTLITQSANGIFRRELISSMSSGPAAALKYYKNKFRIFLMIALAYLLLGNALFGLITNYLLGTGWSEAVRYFHILSPLYALHILYGPLSQVFIVTGELRKDLVMQLSLFVFSMLSLGASCLIINDVLASLVFFSVSNSIMLIFGVWLTYRILACKCIDIKHQ